MLTNLGSKITNKQFIDYNSIDQMALLASMAKEQEMQERDIARIHKKIKKYVSFVLKFKYPLMFHQIISIFSANLADSLFAKTLNKTDRLYEKIEYYKNLLEKYTKLIEKRKSSSYVNVRFVTTQDFDDIQQKIFNDIRN